MVKCCWTQSAFHNFQFKGSVGNKTTCAVINVWGPTYTLTVCVNDGYNLPWSIDSIQNTYWYE